MDLDLISDGPLHRQLSIIQGRLQEAFPKQRFTHDMLPAVLTPVVWGSMVQRAPFVGLAWTGIRPAQSNGRIYMGESRWQVCLVATNSRNSTAARFTGDPQGPGLFGMVQAAAVFLHGYRRPEGDPWNAEGTISVEGMSNAFGDGWSDMNGVCGVLDVSMPIDLTHKFRAEDFLRIGASWPADSATGEPVINDSYNVRQDP